jgi:DNA-directed RNA polymerase specialized sigma24 family protein
MATLAAAFLAARRRRDGVALRGGDIGDDIVGPAISEDHEAASGGLEARLIELAARGAVAHLDLRFESVLFATHLGRCAAPVDTLPASEIHAEDLFLVAAALFGDCVAEAKLRRIHRPVLAGCLRQLEVSTATLEEIERRLWDAALVGDDGGPPRLAGYSGRGALARWVGIAAQRIALKMRRQGTTPVAPREAAAPEATREASDEASDDASAEAGKRALDSATAQSDALAADPELAIIKGKVGGEFQGALTRALGSLEDRERMIYRLHLVDGMAIEMLAKVYRVSHATIARWLVKARDSVIRETQRLLREEMKLSPAEFESVTALVVSQLDLRVSRILR